MPTARELLEQADALMRRNRAAAAAAEAKPPAPLPAAPPSVAPGGMVSPRTIQREPIAPSLASTALAVDPNESPFVVTGLEPPAGAEAVDEADVPVLTEAVDAAVEDDAQVDDVPVLTDAVESIDVEGLDADAAPLVDDTARGEISYWLDARDAGDASLLGPGPDSVAVVPPPGLGTAPPAPPQVPPPGRDPLGLDHPSPGFRGESDGVASSDAGSVEEEDSPGPGAAEARDEAASPDHDLAERGVLSAEDLAEPAAQPAEDRGAGGAPDAAVSADGEAAPAAEAAPAGEAIEAIDIPPLAAPDFEPDPAALAAATPAAFATVGDFGGAAPAGVRGDRPAGDEARIREIAEEIGMQVLQRIDIFTDTSLRDRLAERLRPEIERVSADLVDALNQHVGELLREYVAEAIERELETWRERRGP